eukprot:6470350-Amphidinium_carterae.1
MNLCHFAVVLEPWPAMIKVMLPAIQQRLFKTLLTLSLATQYRRLIKRVVFASDISTWHPNAGSTPTFCSPSCKPRRPCMRHDRKLAHDMERHEEALQ